MVNYPQKDLIVMGGLPKKGKKGLVKPLGEKL